MATPPPSAPPALRRRLLQDIAEVRQEPYPNVYLYVDDKDITHACLVLTPPEEKPLHLEIKFPTDYPLSAPNVTIQSHVDHPNIFNDYICATILNTEEGWTPAYTLKGILIQLLSFFSSDFIEQDYGQAVDLASYKAERRASRQLMRERYSNQSNGISWDYECYICGYDASWALLVAESTKKEIRGQIAEAVDKHKQSKLFELPDEVILNILSAQDTTDIVSLTSAVPTIGKMLNSYDFIRIRELQCFCLKTSFMTTKLGIGVSITKGRKPVLRSEFELLSDEAYNLFHVRKSIQGVNFEKWLPLPLSHRHWKSVRQNADHAMEGLRVAAKLVEKDKVVVLYHFMNTIVVQFSDDADRSLKQPDTRSTLSHVSEKAVEAYFALFHLLLCFATEKPGVIDHANRMVARFLAGPRTKAYFPDLGHLLVAALISDTGLTQDLIFHIIKEAILRNVVWMLDSQGAAMAELAYLEPNAISDYRLYKTFVASRTSYRLLMFLRLFSSAARAPGKSLIQLRDELFDTHGAPPPGISADMARKIRAIHAIDSFPKFLTAMGITKIPTKQEFTSFLRRTIGDSIDAGYSCMPMSQSQLYMIRKMWEPMVEVSEKVEVTPELQGWFDRGEKWYGGGWNEGVEDNDEAEGGIAEVEKS
ncbi:protein polyubiquitination [Kalmusia sp. IMI 367209]|nr:protein polyubiquitination [Kalmusia sp. IMI 367209]